MINFKLDMNSEKLELFPFVITSVRNPDNCDIISIKTTRKEENAFT